MRAIQHRNATHALGVVLAAVAAVAIVLLSATVAFGATVLDYDANRTKNPVADNITRLNVNKLEKGSRDYVKGAHMCIIEKETGRMVTEWVTDGTTHEVARNTGDNASLNTDTVYILRELEAPEGYSQAADTEFVLHSDDQFNTSGEILNGPDAEFDAIQGSGDVQAFVIDLYDEAVIHVEEVEYRKREVSDTSSDEVTPQATPEGQTQEQERETDRGGIVGVLLQTGAYIPLGIVVVIAIGVVGVVLFRRRNDA